VTTSLAIHPTRFAWRWVAPAALVSVCSCATTSPLTTEQILHAYDGPARPTHETAVLAARATVTSGGIPTWPPVTFQYTSGTVITKIDGQFENDVRAGVVSVLPGRHWIEVVPSVAGGSPTCALELRVEAGHVYEIYGAEADVVYRQPNTDKLIQIRPAMWEGKVWITDFTPSYQPSVGWSPDWSAAPKGIKTSKAPATCAMSTLLSPARFCQADSNCTRGRCNRPSEYIAGLCEEAE